MATPVAVSPLTQGGTSPLSIAFTPTQPVAGNKVIVVFWAGFTTTPTITSVVDNATTPNNYTAGPNNIIANTQGVWKYWLDLPANATWAGNYTITVTFSIAPTDSEGGALAYSGVATGAPTATNSGQDAVGSTAATSGSISPAGTGLYVGGLVSGASGNPSTVTAGSGFTNRFVQTNGLSFWVGAGADFPSGSGSKAATWTVTNSAWCALVAFWPDSGTARSQALTVASTTTPSIRRQVGKGVAAQSTTVVTLTRLVGKAVAVQSTTVASLTKQIGKAVAVQTTTLASLGKQVGKAVAAQSTTLVSLATRTGKGVTLTVTSVTAVSIATLKGRGVVLAVTSSTVATMARQVSKGLAVQGATVTSITRQIGKLAMVTSTTLPTIRKGIGKAMAALSSTSVVMTALKAVAQAGTLLRFLVDSREPSTGLGTTRPPSSTSSAEPSTTLASARPSTSLTDTEPPSSVSTNVKGV